MISGLYTSTTGSVLNQKLNLSAFGKFNNQFGPPVLPSGFSIMGPSRILLAPGMPQNVPVIEDEMFSGYTARPRI